MAISEGAGMAIAAGAQILSSGGQMIAGGKMNRKNRDFQRQQNQQQQDWARTNWQLNNEYNTPANQMKRLKEAGINPHLAYQNGAPMNSSNAPANASIAPLPAGKAPNIDPGVIANLGLINAQIENIKADTDNKRANTENTEVITGLNAKDLENKVNLINQENEARSVAIQAQKEGINLTQEKVRETAQNVINLASTNDKIKQEVDNLVSSKGLTEAQTVQVWSVITNLKATYDQIKAQTANIRANTELTHQKSQTEVVNRSNIEADTRNKGEIYKSMVRGNQVGDKFDLSNADAEYKFNDANAKRAFNLVKDSELGNKLLDLKITEQDYINTIRMFEAVSAPANSAKDYRDLLNPFKSSKSTTTTSGGRTTQHRYDAEGNYLGHTSTVTEPGRTVNRSRSRR